MPGKHQAPLDYELDPEFTDRMQARIKAKALGYDIGDDGIHQVSKPTYGIMDMILMCSLVGILMFGASCIYEHALKREPAICFTSQNTCP